MSINNLILFLGLLTASCRVDSATNENLNHKAFLEVIDKLAVYVDSIYGEDIKKDMIIGKYFDDPVRDNGEFNELSEDLLELFKTKYNAKNADIKPVVNGSYNFFTLSSIEKNNLIYKVDVGWSSSHKHYEEYQIQLELEKQKWNVLSIVPTAYR